MKFLETLLNGRRKVVFFDLEGTQKTSEIIAIAAVKVTLDTKYNIKKIDKVIIEHKKIFFWSNRPIFAHF